MKKQKKQKIPKRHKWGALTTEECHAFRKTLPKKIQDLMNTKVWRDEEVRKR